jgi:primosomal protein N' (replication factor Y)
MSVVGCFANVIVDIAANSVRDRLFTYAIPETLVANISPGMPVLVPFGKGRTIAGYVISLSENLPNNFDEQNIHIKEILTILDEQAFFDSQYIEFLKWVADYYLSNLMDVITAALPACLVPRLKHTVQLVQEVKTDNRTQDEKSIIEVLKQSKTTKLSFLTLKQRWCKTTKQKETQFYKAFNNLLGQNIIERESEITAGTKNKTKEFIYATQKESATELEKRIAEVLEQSSQSLTKTQLAKKAHTSAKTIAKLIEQNFLFLHKEEQVRDPLNYLHNQDIMTNGNIPDLTADQSAVFLTLQKALLEERGKSPDISVTPWLLHGVTGSGKTEIYLRVIEETLKQGRRALLMVPEIALTPQLAERLVSRFGKQVAIWHSALSDGERFDTWRRLQNGEFKILLGARSAILVNMPNLGLIILDEEHDASYKQTSPAPRYSAKTLALEKAKLAQALVLFGSATPDIVTYYQAQKENKVLALSKRIFDQGFPQTIIVDMRNEFSSGNRTIFSKQLEQSLQDCLEKKEQAILLLNRRGYASHVFCRACGFVSSCKNCSVPMVYHRLSTSYSGNKEVDLLICHHCGYQSELSHTCPSCDQPFLKNYGLGTQRVEIDVQKLLPQAKILRLDSDIAQRKGAHEEIFQKFATHKADILIGTQMIAKGLDNANVTLVGILAADAAFNLSDYRCTERGFQLLTQVAGRAGRGYLPGKVIVQTFNPSLPALKSSLSHDYQSFYDAELPTRQTYNYPPFSQLIRIVIAGPDLDKTINVSEKLTESLSNYLADTDDSFKMEVLGPAPCLLERLHGKYRQHLIVKNSAGTQGRNLIASFFKNKPLIDDIQIAVDIDAIDLL